jgi:aryl-alcohol dehydrogenase-like predicted oxidoreductase
VASGTIDAVEVMYNVFDQGAAAALLPLCQDHDVGVIARSPLYFGALAPSAEGGMRDFPPEDWRSAYFFDAHRNETEERAQRLVREVEPPDRSLSDLALRFCLSHPAVSTVAVGMRTREHVEANIEALRRGPLEAGKRASLAGHKWLC